MEIRLTSLLLVLGLALTSINCSQSGQKEEENTNDEAAVEASAVSDTEPEPEPENPELIAEYEAAKEGWFKTISENEKMIENIKASILSTKIDERGDQEKKINLLEQLNNRQKTKIALFKPNNVENWERFKKILTEDLNKVTQDLKAMKK